MANSAILGQMFFKVENYGWSENYWLTKPDLDSARIDLEALVTTRLATLYLQGKPRLVYARVSQTAVKGDAQALGFMPRLGTFQVAAPDVDSDPPNDYNGCIMVRFETALGKHSNMYFHGVPDFRVTEESWAFNAQVGDWKTAMLAHINSMQTLCAIRVKTSPPATVPPVYDYQAIARVVPRAYTHKKLGRPFDLHRGRLSHL